MLLDINKAPNPPYACF